jgi:hypothetical protein
MVAGGEYSASDIHADQHGMITVIQCEFGLKRWPYWEPLSESDLRDVQQGVFQWESHPHHSVFLEPGDCLYMRPLTFHSPSGLRRSVLTGFMMWRKSMRTHIEAIIWLRNNPDWSNEFQVNELLPELYRIVRAVVAEQKDPDVWGPENDRCAFVKLARASQRESLLWPYVLLTRNRSLLTRNRCATAGRRGKSYVFAAAVLVS